MEMNISKKGILTELDALKRELKSLASGKNSDVAKVDAHIEAAACIMDKARAALESVQEAGVEKAGSTGHQLRIMNMVNHLDGYGAAMSADELAEALAPMAFDPVTKRMFAAALAKGGHDYKQIQQELDEIYAPHDARRSAISVLKAQAAELRGMRTKIEMTALTKNGAVEKMVDGFCQALEGWNEDLTCYG